MFTLWRCPRYRPHGCSLVRSKNCKPHSITACLQWITITITIFLYTNHFAEQPLVATFGSSFWEQLCRIVWERHFWYRYAESQRWSITLDGSFCDQLWQVIRSNFQEQLLEKRIFGGFFSKNFRAVFTNNCRGFLEPLWRINSFGGFLGV